MKIKNYRFCRCRETFRYSTGKWCILHNSKIRCQRLKINTNRYFDNVFSIFFLNLNGHFHHFSRPFWIEGTRLLTTCTYESTIERKIFIGFLTHMLYSVNIRIIIIYGFCRLMPRKRLKQDKTFSGTRALNPISAKKSVKTCLDKSLALFSYWFTTLIHYRLLSTSLLFCN